MKLALQLALLSSAIAAPASAQERDGPPFEIGIHATGVRARAPAEEFHPFVESRLLLGGSLYWDVASEWSLGAEMDVGWLDQPWTTYVYRAAVRRSLPAFGEVKPFLATGLGGVTTRLDVPGAQDTESDWLVPLVAGARWWSDSSWGVGAEIVDLVVWEEVPCGCVEIGDGPTPKTGDTSATHNIGVSAGIFIRLGGSR